MYSIILYLLTCIYIVWASPSQCLLINTYKILSWSQSCLNVFGIIFNNTLPNTMLWGNQSVLSFRNIMVLCLMFRICFNFHMVVGMGPTSFFCTWRSEFPCTFIKNTAMSPTEWPWYPCEKSSCKVWVYLCIFYFIPLVFVLSLCQYCIFGNTSLCKF
jgi:hypothetical protein